MSTKFTPASSAVWIMRTDSSWSVLPIIPNIIVPRQVELTDMPVPPSVLRSMTVSYVSSGPSSAGFCGRVVAAEHGQHVVDVGDAHDQLTVGRAQEAGLDRAVEEVEQGLPEAVEVEHPDRLGVDAELGPRGDLGQLLERAEPTGQGEEGVGLLGHALLALVHRVDLDQLGDALVADLVGEQALRGSPRAPLPRRPSPRRPRHP